MDALKVLHDYCYVEPQHPVPQVGAPAHLAYDPSASMPAVQVDLDASGFVRMTVTVEPADIRQALAAARDDLVTNLKGDPADEAQVRQLRERMGERDFDMQVSSVARTYFLSAAVLRTGLFPMLQPDARGLDVIDPAALDAPYSFAVTFPILPSSELTSYEPVDVEVPERPAISGEEMNERMREMAGDAGVPEPGTDEFTKMHAEAVRQLGAEASARWSDELMTRCNHELSRRLVSDPPLGHVQLVTTQMCTDVDRRLREQGSSYAQYVSAPGFDRKAFERDLREQAELTLRTSIAVDALAEHVGVMVNRRELLESVGERAAGDDHDRPIIALMMMTGQLPELLQVARRYKTSDMLARRSLALYESRHAESPEARAETQAQTDAANAMAGGMPARDEPDADGQAPVPDAPDAPSAGGRVPPFAAGAAGEAPAGEPQA